MYALPMVKGRVPGLYVPSGRGTLEIGVDLQLVYDPPSNITWLADADLAKTHWFNAQCQNSDGTLCITADGSMQDSTAQNWINGMNAVRYLGVNRWQFPSDKANGKMCGGWGCTTTDFGNLYYNQLGLTQGTPVVDAPNINVQGFHNLQPYLYWACGAPAPCQNKINAPGHGGSFSFGNGFQGTDLKENQLYATAYFPQTPIEALREAIRDALPAGPQQNTFLADADAIHNAPDAQTKASALQAFVNLVNSVRGAALTNAQADQLVGLANAV
jgi:hypothetical protein